VLTLDEVRPGLALGRYECLLPIARGGMAAVWAARARGARGFTRMVAIKTMLPSLSADPQFETMFLDEARIASRIRHPNVVEIIDLGEQQSLLYIVMEWIDGEPLSTLMRKAGGDGRLPMGIAARIMADTCAGLHAAHEVRDDDGNLVGLVHRDISPQNVMVSYDGLVKLLDFGVAKAGGVSTAETAAGHVKGKIAYMAPEQVLSEKVDRRTDVFACGIVLYQITTGKHPFRGDNDAATIHNVLRREVPSPRQFVPDCPPRLHQIVMKALQKNREKRFQSAAEMANELEELARVGGSRTTAQAAAEFVKSVAGTIGEERRALLKKALHDAEGRHGNTAAMLADSADPVQHTPASGNHLIHSEPGRAAMVSDPSQAGISVVGPGTVSVGPAPPEVSRSRRRMTGGMIGAAVVAGIAIPIIVVAAMKSGPGPAPVTSSQVTSSVPVATSITPPVSSPAPAVSSVVVAPSASAAPQSTAPTTGTKGKGAGGSGPAKTGGTKGWVPPLADPGF